MRAAAFLLPTCEPAASMRRSQSRLDASSPLQATPNAWPEEHVDGHTAAPTSLRPRSSPVAARTIKAGATLPVP